MFQFSMLFDYAARGFLVVILLFIVPIILIVRLIQDVSKEIQFFVVITYLIVISVSIGWLMSSI